MIGNPMPSFAGKRILLIIAGGIAAYKSLETIRLLRRQGVEITAILTEGGAQFVTPLSVAALTESPVHTALWSLTREVEMGHIQLSRSADLVVVAPATADILARMATGIADDLATTALLATDKPVLAAPAMNVRMWQHPATKRNVARLIEDGVAMIGPDEGDMACGEFGPGRMAEPDALAAAILDRLRDAPRSDSAGPLTGRRALVTSGPTHEPLDPVRYLANRSSGRQGHAIAAALAALGAQTLLVTGPTNEDAPAGVETVTIETAVQMLDACRKALPVDVAVCAAAVADWRPDRAATSKLKKSGDEALSLAFVQNPDILKTLSEAGPHRPELVIGFAAETDDLMANADAKRRRKGCDWILANAVGGTTDTFGGAENTIHLLTGTTTESWPRMSKTAVADRLAERIAEVLGPQPSPRQNPQAPS